MINFAAARSHHIRWWYSYSYAPNVISSSIESRWRGAEFWDVEFPKGGTFDHSHCHSFSLAWVRRARAWRRDGEPWHREASVGRTAMHTIIMAEDNFCGEWEGDWGGRILYVSKGFIENFACNLIERLKPEICKVSDGVKYTESPRITHLMSLLHADVLAGCLDGPSLGEQLIIRILNHLFPEKEDRVIGRRRGSAVREINSLRDMIHAQIGSHLSLQDLASASGLSSRQLCRIFRTETGASPHAYIMRCRVERACALIAESKLGLAEIASICGFSDQAHMTVTFRKLLKSSPSEFRSKSRSRVCRGAIPDVSRSVV